MPNISNKQRKILALLDGSAVESEPIEGTASKRGEPSPAPLLNTFSALELQHMDIPPIEWIVDGLLPHGLGILASPSKYGKSWMVLDLCLNVAAGGKFLGFKTTMCDCLYLALEDSQRRLKERMNAILNGVNAPSGFYYATTTHVIGSGLFEELESHLGQHPDTRLIVIDTLQKVRSGAYAGEGAYAADYRETGALKEFADFHNLAVVLVYHLRKMKDDGDPFNRISGTNGIMGAADTIMVLTREKRKDTNTLVSVTGRDVESGETIIRFNKSTHRWESLGDADRYAEQQARADYETAPLVQTIKKLLEDNPDGWSGTMQQLMDAGKEITGIYISATPTTLSKDLKAIDILLFDNDRISHTVIKNGSGAKKHKLCYVGNRANKSD